MISMLIYDEIEKEQRYIHEVTKRKAAYLTEEKWEITLVRKLSEMKQHMETVPLLDIACVDITKEKTLDYLKEIRRKYAQMFLLVIADTSISPRIYMKPSIMPSALLLRPCGEEEIKRVISELLEVYVQYFEKGEGHESYVIESKEGKIYIPYDKIFYFESKEKKVYIQTDGEEYGFYSTIDKLESELPSHFIRCHRSFIVNTRKIEKVMLSQNIIYLKENRDVPLSRSYKAIIKELGKK